MKIPEYMHKKQVHVCHPSSTLKSVAKALEIEAREYGKAGNRIAGAVLRTASMNLRRVAQGETFSEAFGWTQP